MLCGLLIEADGYFNGKDVDAQKINDEPDIKSYCRNGGCKTNEEHINALIAYIFKLFKESINSDEYNDYDEYLLMWISDKLYNMHKEAKNIKRGYVDPITLNQAYEKYLKKHKVILDYWDLLGIIPGLKNANLKYMTEFYKLLNNICNTIKEYNDNGVESKKLSKNSIGCRRQYRTLYNNISECKSYLHLLNKLKGIYDDFRSFAIKENSSNIKLADNLEKLTLENGKEMSAVRTFRSYNFSNQQCKGKKKKKTDKPSLQSSSKKESLPPKEPLKQDSPEPAPPSPQEPQPETQQSSSTTPSEEPPAKVGLSSSSLQESQKPGKNDQNEPKDSGKETGGSKSEIKGPEVGSEKKNGEDKEPRTPSGGEGSQISKGDGSNGESSGTNAGKGDSEGGSGDSDGKGAKDSQPGGSSSGTENRGQESSDKDSGSNTEDKNNLQIDKGITQDNSMKQHEGLSTSGGSVDDSPKDKESTDSTMEQHQQNGSLEPNPQEKPQDSPKETPPIQEPETKESEQQPFLII
ncbi:Plasmodium variant antigen protein Cir/Yir/Bir, putative [Plasmodium chabaudi adami]|uniref:Plasmodium variant antigen protein Cir/Yir/Bir, putative n=1 Tax=Plasmodium chabaudi adami TaxID=5826 RepID=A0A1D3LBX8_PLACE|nr:Plasmodium variant antigen protein Cir/Yir/Bir, putative [Plasmodium chabaudi adami]